MKVSVVIPTYFRAHDLSELFDSILKQTVKPFEVIVVDDTPNDSVKKVCDKFREIFRRFGIDLIYIRNPRERSSAIARNVGAERARGDIIMFFDSDIILMPNYIEEILKVFKEKKDAVGVQGWIVPTWLVRLKKEWIISKHKKYLLIRYLLDQLMRRFFMLGTMYTVYTKDECKLGSYPIILTKVINCERLSGSNMAFRREIFNRFRFDENLKGYAYMEDTLLTYSVFKEFPRGLYMTPYAKCIHKRSIEGKKLNEEWRAHLDWCRKYVLMKLFGWKGTIIYYWQTIGVKLYELRAKLGPNILGRHRKNSSIHV
ncbi:hypothetical protein DRN63_04625 [Nanoarchaeota archaeon]|nr:MAG: hypothetical protein DRN63_04625 [Nanoarchaeota archaeon]